MIGPIGTLVFTHDIQVGHRLYLQPGKCQQIHGHSMEVSLRLEVHFNEDGYAINDEGRDLEFGAVKKIFRDYLDGFYDHHLLLNENDPWADIFVAKDNIRFDDPEEPASMADWVTLPGLRKVPGDPSTENIALWIARWCAEELRCLTIVEVQETKTNAVVRTATPSLRKANHPMAEFRGIAGNPGEAKAEWVHDGS